MSDTRRLRTTASAIVGIAVLTITAGHLLSDGGAWKDAAFGATLIAAPYGLLTLVAQWASLPAWLMATAAMVALTWGVVGLASDAHAGIVFIFIIPLQVFVVAAAGWRLLKPNDYRRPCSRDGPERLK